MDCNNVMMHMFAGFGIGVAFLMLLGYGQRAYDQWKNRRK